MAAELLDGSGDGVWLAELAAVTDEDAVPAAMCEALRVTGQPGRPVLEVLLDALALQDVLNRRLGMVWLAGCPWCRPCWPAATPAPVPLRFIWWVACRPAALISDTSPGAEHPRIGGRRELWCSMR